MMEGLPLPSVETITPVTLYIILVLLLFFERIVPIGRVRDAQKAADILREANEKQAAVIATQAETNKLLVDGVGKTVEKVMGELQSRARDGSDAHDVA
jgi:type II secretory pathway component GspD/PulD (secretin)